MWVCVRPQLRELFHPQILSSSSEARDQAQTCTKHFEQLVSAFSVGHFTETPPRQSYALLAALALARLVSCCFKRGRRDGPGPDQREWKHSDSGQSGMCHLAAPENNRTQRVFQR